MLSLRSGRLPWLWFGTAVAGVVAPVFRPAAATVVQQGGVSAAAADPRLSRRVSDEQVGGTLGEYLAQLARSAKVEQQVASPFDARALLALKVDTSLRRLHGALARNYRLTWRASAGVEPRYTLSEGASDRLARQSALLAARQRAAERMRARWEEVRALAFLDSADLERAASAGERKGLDLKHPLAQGMARMLFQLPEDPMRQFWATGETRVAVGALPQEVQALARSVARQDLPDPGIVSREGGLTLKIGGTLDRPTVYAEFKYGRDGVVHNLLYNEGTTRQPPEERRREAEAVPTRPPRDARFKKAVSLRDPAIHQWRESPGERPAKAKPLAELLQDLAGQVDLAIVAECEYRPKDARWLRQQWWLGGELEEVPLSRALDLLCADFEFEWRFLDGFLLFRPRLWFADPEQRVYVWPKFREQARPGQPRPTAPGGEVRAYDRPPSLRSLPPPETVDVPIRQAIHRMKTVPLDGDLVRTARALGISFGESLQSDQCKVSSAK